EASGGSGGPASAGTTGDDGEPGTDDAAGTDDGADTGAADTTGGDPTDSGGGEWPDALPVDCLDDANAEELACTPFIQLDPGSIGAGPHFGIGMFPGVLGGFVDDANERLVVGTRFGVDVEPGGAVATVDLRTGERVFVSGHWDDPANGPMELGSGAPIDFVFDVAPTAAGWVAIGQLGGDTVIVTVDPATGARTALTPEGGSGCTDPDGIEIVIDPYAIAVADDGTVMTTFRGTDAGIGIVGYADGGCAVVSRMGGAGAPIGGGPDQSGGYFVDLAIDGATLWGLEWQSQSVFSIDIASGQRKRISSSSSSTAVAEGPPVRGQSLAVTASGIVTYDDEGITLVDPATGNRTAVLVDGPLVLGVDGHVLAHPNAPWLVVLGDVGVGVLDTATGNSNIVSF
ncbi:MAG TPA: hypothetical protein VFG69_19000, partial [Nannocystaceae bacterium]|nr:hypothetical protein [Nannocystaceae bacterium]